MCVTDGIEQLHGACELCGFVRPIEIQRSRDRGSGIKVHVNMAVTAIERQDDRLLVRARTGEQEHTIEADLVVHAAGRVPEIDDLELVSNAALKSGANVAIEKLPEGYETMLGRWFQDGVQLSGGEWQKVALARAFMRDARILILDEPTSSLDAQAEYDVFAKFRVLTRGKTAIFISHRFSTVRLADRILVIENGRLIENGAHQELIALGGRYAELFNLQAEAYR